MGVLRAPIRGVAALLAFVLVVGLGTAAGADAADDRRALVLLRVLAYDNHLSERAGDEVRIVIVYPPGDGGAAERARWTAASTSALLRVGTGCAVGSGFLARFFFLLSRGIGISLMSGMRAARSPRL